MLFVSVMLTAVCNLAAFETQPLASSHFNSHKQNHVCVRLFMTAHVAVLLVIVHKSFD